MLPVGEKENTGSHSNLSLTRQNKVYSHRAKGIKYNFSNTVLYRLIN